MKINRCISVLDPPVNNENRIRIRERYQEEEIPWENVYQNNLSSSECSLSFYTRFQASGEQGIEFNKDLVNEPNVHYL